VRLKREEPPLLHQKHFNTLQGTANVCPVYLFQKLEFEELYPATLATRFASTQPAHTVQASSNFLLFEVPAQ
jgi:hypothetical protein